MLEQLIFKDLLQQVAVVTKKMDLQINLLFEL